LKSEGTALHDRETIIDILRHDVQSVDQILGDKNFILGSQPTTVNFFEFIYLFIFFSLISRHLDTWALVTICHLINQFKAYLTMNFHVFENCLNASESITGLIGQTSLK
jgi:hypothetical protein